ncbi:hypothetical protein ACFX1R_000300 [Malus domestica]
MSCSTRIWTFCFNLPDNFVNSTVYKVIHRPTGRLYALKVIYGNHEIETLRQIYREIEILRNVDKPNVVKCHDLFDHNGEIQVLLEYMDGGSLEGQHIGNEKALSNLARQILSSFAYLHRRKIHPPAMTFDEISMERSKSFVKALQELKNLRPQLYSAAEYCEKSYLHSEQKQMQTSDVSTMDLKVTCLNQKLLACKTYMDKEGSRQQQHNNGDVSLVKSQPLVKVLQLIRAQEHGSLFERRLPAQESDKYKSIVQQHVDLETIQTKLRKDTYSSCSLSFYRDLLLLFNNAVVFFPKSSLESMTAHQLRRLVLNEMKKKNLITRPNLTPSSRPTPGSEWSIAQASVMEIRILVEALQLSAHQNLTTQLVVAHVQELEIQLGRLHWDTPVDFIVVDIQRGQACRKLHL